MKKTDKKTTSRTRTKKEIAISCRDLVRSFKEGGNELVVLKSIDMDIEKGDFISITGKSGTGKSTLIYQLGLLDNPTSGSIFYDGKDSSKFSQKEKTKYRLDNFGFVFQHYALMQELTARENIAVPIMMRGKSAQEAYRDAEEILERIGLKDRINSRPTQLSGGESQRVSIARAIVHKPKILFADEPTANLDTERSEQIIDIFEELNKEGQTIVMVTHEVEYANRAKQVVVMKDGIISE